jgi:hypothetical protein
MVPLFHPKSSRGNNQRVRIRGVAAAAAAAAARRTAAA